MTTIEEFAAGKSIPVPLKDVERSITTMFRKLAESAKAQGKKQAVVRACLWNMIVRTPGGAAFAQAKQLIDEISPSFAARALVIDADRGAPTAPIQAWIEANWHDGGGGAQYIGSEELTFKASGETVLDLASVVRALVLGDVPLASVWQGVVPTCDALDQEMILPARRLIVAVDGAEETVRGISALIDSGKMAPGASLTSLAWLRSSHWRQLVASLFDAPTEPEEAYNVVETRIVCGPEHVNAALFLIGWLATRLGWQQSQVVDRGDHTYRFAGPKGEVQAAIDVGGTSDDIFTRIELGTQLGRYSLSRIDSSIIFETPEIARKLPRHIPRDGELWLSALTARGHDPSFVPAVRSVAALVR